MPHLSYNFKSTTRYTEAIAELYSYVSRLSIDDAYEVALGAITVARDRHGHKNFIEQNYLSIITALFCIQKILGEESIF